MASVNCAFFTSGYRYQFVKSNTLEKVQYNPFIYNIVKFLTQFSVPAYEWSQPFFCSERHTVAHHSRIAVLRNHTNPTIVDIRIGSAGRIKKRRQFHAKYLVLLKQLVDSELMKHKAEEKLPTSLIDRLLKPRIKATSIPSRETIDYTKPYIPFSYGSSTILPERFKQHSEHHHQIVSIVNWEK